MFEALALIAVIWAFAQYNKRLSQLEREVADLRDYPASQRRASVPLVAAFEAPLETAPAEARPEPEEKVQEEADWVVAGNARTSSVSKFKLRGIVRAAASDLGRRHHARRGGHADRQAVDRRRPAVALGAGHPGFGLRLAID